jgi:dienelactone hydrolase
MIKNYKIALLILLILGSFGQRLHGEEQAEEFIAVAQSFLELLLQEKYSQAITLFDKTMKSAFPEEKLKSTWKTVLQQAGAFKKQVSTRTQKVQIYTIVFITCEFEKAPLEVKIALDESKKIAGLFFAPTQIPKSKTATEPSTTHSSHFYEKEIRFGSEEWKLPATLTIPKGKEPFSAVVLVHGSGPNDRDETIGPNKPFRDLAWGLAGKGIAVLRYEKRSKEHGKKLVSLQLPFTVQEETVEDAVLAVEFLQTQKEIDRTKIFVLGHSLGAMLAPRIATMKADLGIAGLILMAGTARPLDLVILEQLNYIFGLDAKVSEEEKKHLEEVQSQLDSLKSLDKGANASSPLILGAPPSYWFDLQSYSPTKVVQEVKQNLLILQGERDYQVTMEDFQLWKSALVSRENVQFKSYPKLNHLFIEGEGKSMPAEYEKRGEVAKEVIEDIAQWIKK